MASAPGLTVVAVWQQGFDLGSRGHLVGRVSAQYNSGFWRSYLHQGTFQRAFTRTDLSLTYTPDVGNWNVQAYDNNIENSAVFGGIGQASPASTGAGPPSPPSTSGLRLSVGWGKTSTTGIC